MNEFSVLTGVTELLPGAVGGVCNVCVGHPMDLIKVRQQFSSSNTHHGPYTMLRSIFAKEGMNGLYRGVSSPLLAVTPAFAISFYSFDWSKSMLQKYSESSQLSAYQIALAGGFSGIPLAVVVGPSDRIKCLMQVSPQKYHGFTDCLRHVYREGGIASVFRGTGSAMLRDVPGNAAYFAGYEMFRRVFAKLEGRQTPSMFGTFMAGGLGGVSNWIVAIPFDVVKSRWQTAPAGKYKNLLDVLKQLMEKEGVSALFRGLSPALLRAFPANGACLMGFESVKTMVASQNR